MHCEFCQKYPNIIKQFSPRARVPMATTGARYRADRLAEHIESDFHKECARLFRLSSVADENICMTIDVAVNKANLKMINHVSKLMIQIYYDAKQLNQAAHNWPARFVVSSASYAYDAQNRTAKISIIPENIPVQYVNKPGHLFLMTTIVNSDLTNFIEKLKNSYAISLRIDGSVDSTQVDKIYVMAKIINSNGKLELLFIGIAQQIERKAVGLTKATLDAIDAMMGSENRKKFLKCVSSVCTDGTNVNTGDRNSLWAWIKK